MIPLRDSHPSRTTPVVTISLIAVNSLVFLYQFSLDAYSLNHFVATYGLVPDRFHFLPVLTSMFLHGGWAHLIGNMWFLWIFGDNVEDILGRAKYLLFYLLCGIAATLAHYAVNLDSRVPMVGASGAIAGVMGAYMLKFPHSRVTTLVVAIIFFTTVELPAWVVLVYWFVIQFFSGLGTIGYSHLSQGGTAWFAHIGGFVAGIILIKVLPTEDRYFRRPELRW